jgi:3-methyladenine DNA glycosylase AlkD
MRGSSAVHRRLVRDMVAFVQTELGRCTKPRKGDAMQQYLKTAMPMYGLQKPERAAVEKRLHARFSDVDVCQDSYEACVRGLWDLPHREEKYLAIDFAMKHKEFIGPDSMGLYESMLREDYMWWDLVDPIASTLVGIATLTHPAMKERTLRQWTNDDSMWIRRTALIAHLKHKTETDQNMLFEFCLSLAHARKRVLYSKSHRLGPPSIQLHRARGCEIIYGSGEESIEPAEPRC